MPDEISQLIEDAVKEVTDAYRAGMNVKPLSYSPPVERVCMSCHEKHFGRTRYCSRCRSELDAGCPDIVRDYRP